MTTPPAPTAAALARALALIDAMKPRDESQEGAPRMTAVFAVARAAVDLVESDPDWWAERPGNDRCWCSICQGWRAEVATPAEVIHATDCPALAIAHTVAALAALAAPAEAVAPSLTARGEGEAGR